MARDDSRISRIVAIAEPIAAERGLEILDVELGGSPASPLVRVLLDSPEESRRIGIEDCQAVSQRLGDGLDAYEVLRGRYMLEVSSPGVNRPLKRLEHFQRVVGRKIRVRAKTATGERRTWIGRLAEVGDAVILLLEDSATEPVRIELADVERANLEFEFEQKAPPGGRHKAGAGSGRDNTGRKAAKKGRR